MVLSQCRGGDDADGTGVQLVSVAVGAMEDAAAPPLGQALDTGKLVTYPNGQDKPPRIELLVTDTQGEAPIVSLRGVLGHAFHPSHR